MHLATHLEQVPVLLVPTIAGVVAMLLSEDGRWINGQVFNVNGGALMRSAGAFVRRPSSSGRGCPHGSRSDGSASNREGPGPRGCPEFFGH